MAENDTDILELLLAEAPEASPELTATARDCARALAPLGLPPAWAAAAAAVPLLAAGALPPAGARKVLGPTFELASHAAALPDPRLAAGEAVRTEDPAQAERLRRLFLGVVRDIRVVPLVLARQLARLESLKGASAEAREAAAHETFILYAPLANRLGMWQLKWPLEDLAFRLEDPVHYSEIAARLAERRTERERRLAAARQSVEETLARAEVQGEVTGRPKHIYSIWRKLQRKGVTMSELYDLMGVRIVVSDIADCYAALGAVHGRWQALPGEFDDYIAAPKENFYRSLHTAVLDDAGHALEIQIRTSQMHRDAELGVAAHWRYKEEASRDTALEERIAWLRQLLSAGEETGLEDSLVGQVTSELAAERVYALTPRGRVIDLPLGATPLDFAYAVHTELGHRTSGARVNGRMVPLTRELATGDAVEILTHPRPRPSRDWLRPESGYLRTRRAQQKLKAWFRQGAADNDAASPVKPAPPVLKPPRRRHRRPPSVRAVVSGMPELPAEPARCCNPVPGDPLVAFVTRGRGIRLHRQDCPSFRSSAARAPRQVLDAGWSGPGAAISIAALDRPGLVGELTAALAARGLAVRSLDANTVQGEARVHFRLDTADAARLEPALLALAAIPGVRQTRLGDRL